MQTKVLIADGDQMTANWLKSILERDGYTVDTVRDGAAALRKIAQELPDLVVLEAALPDGDGLGIVRYLRQSPLYRDLHLIIFSKGTAADIKVGMAAGADDYVVKRPGADIQLIDKVRALLAQPKKSAPEPEVTHGQIHSLSSPPEHEVTHGQILSFLSAKGGTGTTSVMINTAYALAQQEPAAEILIVDLVFPMGTVGLSLGFESRETVVKLTHEPEITRAAIEKYVSPRTQWGFRMLIGANDPQEATNLAVDQIVPLFETLRTMYDYILVDFGRALSRISLPIIEISERVVIILTPDIGTVKGTRLIMQHLRSLDISLDRVFVINNRTVGRVWTTIEDMERELGVKLGAMIPYTVEYMTMAINEAVPFMKRFPDNSASAVFKDIAERLRARVVAKTD